MRSILAGLLIAGTTAAARAESGVADVLATSTAAALSGTVTFRDTDDGLSVKAEITGLPAGTHGFHIHEFGTCGDSGKAAGGHYNPKESHHGFLPKDGIKRSHGGDMGNIVAGPDGVGKLELILPKITLTGGKHNVAGRAVVIHEKADDFGQPVGNAGGRIGCAPILLVKP